MTRFSDHLWSDLVREHGATLEHAHRPEPGPARLLRRPRLLAGSTLGLAGVGTALVLVLGAAGSPPAYAVTTNSDGSVTVQISETSSLPQANAKLTAMGINEQVTIYMAPGPAAVSGPVNCTPGPGASLPKPPVKVLVGTDGTEVIGPGQSGDNTGEGTWHLARCTVAPDADTGPGAGNTGNTGNTGALPGPVPVPVSSGHGAGNTGNTGNTGALPRPVPAPVSSGHGAGNTGAG